MDPRGGRSLRLMDGELWEGEADAGSVELLIDMLVDIEEDVPVVLVRRPSTDDNVHATRTEREQSDGVVGGLEDA